MEKNIWDLIIIGAGPAGLTAALYAARRNMSTLVITKDIGGQAAMTNEIENYPGFESIAGPELMTHFHKQTEKWGAQYVYNEVTEIVNEKDGGYSVTAGEKKYNSHAVILAFGLEHRHLDVPGEKEFYGKGVTYCATCDGPLFKNKTICVVGGGNSALDAIDYMSKLATKVYALVRKDKFKGEGIMIDVVSKNENVEIMYNTEIKEILGDKFVSGIKIFNNTTKEDSNLELQGVFVEVGYQPNTKLYASLVEMTEQGAIKVNDKCETNRPGFFAAGDTTTLPYKQIISSGGEGCKAALTAYTYVQKRKGMSGEARQDWTKK